MDGAEFVLPGPGGGNPPPPHTHTQNALHLTKSKNHRISAARHVILSKSVKPLIPLVHLTLTLATLALTPQPSNLIGLPLTSTILPIKVCWWNSLHWVQTP